MRHLLLSLFTFLLPAIMTAEAQTPIPVPSRNGVSLTVRAGHLLHSADPMGGCPGGGFTFGGDYSTGRFLIGGTLDLEKTPGTLSTASVRTGFGTSSRSFSLSVYASARYRWTDTCSGWMAGVGGTLDWRILGPLGLFASLEYARPVVSTRYYSYLTYYGQTVFSYGLCLKF